MLDFVDVDENVEVDVTLDVDILDGLILLLVHAALFQDDTH